MKMLDLLPQYFGSLSTEAQSQLEAQLGALLSPIAELEKRTARLLEGVVRASAGAALESGEPETLKLQRAVLGLEHWPDQQMLGRLAHCYAHYADLRGTREGLLFLLRQLLPEAQFSICENRFLSPAARVGEIRLGDARFCLHHEDSEARALILTCVGVGSVEVEILRRLLAEETPVGQSIFVVFDCQKEAKTAGGSTRTSSWFQLGDRI